MAKQEFLSGGFIGKVGNVVGEHWKNKRYIRTYVKTPNPNTPAQQAARAAFKHGIDLSQQAMNINGGAPFWQRNDLTEWQWRNQTAIRRILAGLPDDQALPLYPDGYVKQTKTTGVSFEWVKDDETVLVRTASPVMTEARSFRYVIHCFNRKTGEYGKLAWSITVESGETLSFEMPWTSMESYPADCWVEAATTDDNKHDGNAIVLDRTPVSQPEVPEMTVVTNITGFDFSTSPRLLTLSSDEKMPPLTYSVDIKVRTYNMASGEWSVKTYSNAVLNGVFQPLQIPWNTNNAYPDGAKIEYSHGYYPDPMSLTWEVSSGSFVQPSVPT